MFSWEDACLDFSVAHCCICNDPLRNTIEVQIHESLIVIQEHLTIFLPSNLLWTNWEGPRSDWIRDGKTGFKKRVILTIKCEKTLNLYSKKNLLLVFPFSLLHYYSFCEVIKCWKTALFAVKLRLKLSKSFFLSPHL